MSDSIYHAKYLRAIGQDLESRRITQFSLRLSENGYLLRRPLREVGRAAGSETETRDERDSGSSSHQQLEYLYTADAIERLDEIGRSRRGVGNGMPDFLSLSQCLRALGAALDAKRGRLLQLDRATQMNATPLFSIQYKNSTGEQVREDHTLPNLYDYCVRFYKTRRPESHDDDLDGGPSDVTH